MREEQSKFTGLYDIKGLPIYKDDIIKVYRDVGIVQIGRCTDMTVNMGEYSIEYYGVYLDLSYKNGSNYSTDNHCRCDFDQWEKLGSISDRELYNYWFVD